MTEHDQPVFIWEVNLGTTSSIICHFNTGGGLRQELLHPSINHELNFAKKRNARSHSRLEKAYLEKTLQVTGSYIIKSIV